MQLKKNIILGKVSFALIFILLFQIIFLKANSEINIYGEKFAEILVLDKVLHKYFEQKITYLLISLQKDVSEFIDVINK